MSAIQTHRVQPALVTECAHSLRISCTWIPLISSHCWWVCFVGSCLNCVGGKHQKLLLCAFLFKARKFTRWGSAYLGVSCQFSPALCLPDMDIWMSWGCFAGGWEPAEAWCQISKAAQWIALPASCSRWGRDSSSERLLRNGDVNSSLGMWEQRSSPTNRAVSVIRKPEKSGGPCFPSEYRAPACKRPGRAGGEARRGKQAAARSSLPRCCFKSLSWAYTELRSALCCESKCSLLLLCCGGAWVTPDVKSHGDKCSANRKTASAEKLTI